MEYGKNGVSGAPLTLHERGVSGKPTAFDKLMQSPQWRAAKMHQDPVTKKVFTDVERYDGAKFIVDQLWKTEHTVELKKRLEGIEPVFITMPSTSRQNVLPKVLAGKLQEELGGNILSGEAIAAPLFDKEMKTVPNSERPFVPREFFLHSPDTLREETAGKAGCRC